jgi:beta-glucanase (GH16 family)
MTIAHTSRIRIEKHTGPHRTAHIPAQAADSVDQLPPAPHGKTWKLVRHDEFDGDRLDDSRWDVPDKQRRDGTEIDIMEKPRLDDRVQHALHWDGDGEAHRSKGQVSTVPGVMDGWHTFALWWKADEYVFYVDGKEMWRTDAGGVCQVPLYAYLVRKMDPKRIADVIEELMLQPPQSKR